MGKWYMLGEVLSGEKGTKHWQVKMVQCTVRGNVYKAL